MLEARPVLFQSQRPRVVGRKALRLWLDGEHGQSEVVDCARGDFVVRGGVVESFVDDWARGVREGNAKMADGGLRMVWESGSNGAN